MILAELVAGDPKEIAAKAKEAAQERWEEFAKEARQRGFGVIRADIWEDQVDDVIEFYAAWVPRSDNYQHDRARVMRLLAGRKNCRDFRQPEYNDTGLPKSSLDGQRPTVLVGPKPGESRETYRDDWPKKLRLSSGEQLDVIGMTKRLGKKIGDSDPRYPSVARVAAETWLRGIRGRSEFEDLKNTCQKLVAKGLNTVREERYQYFPYEGTVIYRDRHADLRKELGLGDNDLDAVAAALKELGGEPNPYLLPSLSLTAIRWVRNSRGFLASKTIKRFRENSPNSPVTQRKLSEIRMVFRSTRAATMSLPFCPCIGV